MSGGPEKSNGSLQAVKELSELSMCRGAMLNFPEELCTNVFLLQIGH